MSWKMVRDRHRVMLDGKVSGKWRTSPDPVAALIAKLGEEYGELAATRDPEEVYDVLDTAGELARLLDPQGHAASRHQEKAEIMGGFRDHLEWHPDPDLDLRSMSRVRRIAATGEQ